MHLTPRVVDSGALKSASAMVSDDWSIGAMVLVSHLLAVLFHANMNERPLFDTCGWPGRT